MLKIISKTSNCTNIRPIKAEDDKVIGTKGGGDKKIKNCSKSKNLTKSKKFDSIKVKIISSPKIVFLISEAKLVFTQLKKAFTKILIFYHFDLKRYF